MIEFVQSLGAVVAFLLPIGIYFLILASINRRSRPVMVSGAWDAIGLMFAASGFLLVTVPVLMAEAYKRTAGVTDSVVVVWAMYWLIWVVYFFLLIVGGAFLVLVRGDKTLIYNVDLELFPKILDQSLAVMGLEAHRNPDRLVVGPARPRMDDDTGAIMATAPPTEDRRHAELKIDTFTAMSHVTLHWGRCTPAVRREIEAELNRNLEQAAPMENAAAGWFLSVSGMVLGAVAAILLAMVFLLVMTWR